VTYTEPAEENGKRDDAGPDEPSRRMHRTRSPA